MSGWGPGGNYANLGKPTLAGFIAWMQDVVQVPTSALPSNSPVIPIAYGVALDLCLTGIQAISQDIYTLCVYNLAMDNLINYAPDQTGQTYFQDLRKQFGINNFVAGVVQSTSDESTSTSYAVSEDLKNLSLADLMYLKTPYGRLYMSYAMRLGPLWGMS
jgi:hypothetical protein